ncbi:hypothetical protein [Mycolicibacterium sp. lyk4-40-TYG-92]|uniref:hypothetical protein n=1 Tax=Mycolicibacterium sp. lyk4-40-TYG-92 TaxID=3040295 RepID=UPI00254A7543|nr:hypothetical protein [Mycolicibacterium sp. lyk4-40-TYG-92]
MTDDEFFSATNELRTIYQWARARYAAPWAVFFAVLIRVAASVGPHVRLPGVIGGQASINLLVAFVSFSGGGKGISDKVGRLAWPATILELPLGTGEGIAETYMLRGKESEDNERITAAIFNCSEIDILTGLDARQGSTTLGTLKAFAMGEQFGSTNASKASSRNVPAHSYRGCVSVGAQPGHTGVIFNDASGGTPQRFLWAPTTDPDMPAEHCDDPPPLDTQLPLWGPNSEGVVEVQYGPVEIRQTIISAHLARQRGEGDALDGHWMLTRLKVAATIALLHHRIVVSEHDWQLSAAVMAKSDSTRAWMLEQARKANRAKVRDRAMTRAAFDEFIEGRHTETVRRRIIKLLTDGSMPHGALRRAMGKQHYREAFDAVLPHLEKISQVVIVKGDKVPHYALNPEFTGEPEFTPENSSSEGVNQEFTGEPAATVIDMETRRSHDPTTPKLSATKWLGQHVTQLRAAGHQQVESFAVLDAAEAQGYKRQSIVAEASKHPEIRVVGRGSDGTMWWIDPTQSPPAEYRSAAEWIEEYVSALPDGAEIDKDDFKSKGTPRYSWENLRKAIKERADIRVTSQGPRSTWTVQRDEEVGA